ncbi:hypothetical protein PROH_02110 [Prochlorothrix hollandica PCC 9006 = CALU 1027]|uniref:Phosphonate ABC transporter substrate-binding protein n=2 Tax=Prochlorothrix hollandica TaxID=1223 RepID=A0A0M2Q3M4_PROHO|nr:hypothetical protein PROH_02110 [Prochlorothrix hollandica PCC 9006 = CALU 1027]
MQFFHRLLGTTCALVLLSAACTTLNPGVGTSPTGSDRGQSTTTPVDAELSELTIAMIPDRRGKDGEERLQKFTEYLETSLEMPVTVEVTPDYDTAVALLVHGTVAMAYLGPLTYVEAKAQNASIEPIVAHIESSTGYPWYTSVVVANGDQGIKTIADLRGKDFGFVSDSSTSGFLVPRSFLLQQGIDPDRDFRSVQFSGSHDQNVAHLAKGSVDAIAIDKAAYEVGLRSGLLTPEKQILLWESDPIPNPPIVANGRVSSELRLKIQRVLVNAPPGLASINSESAAGYTIVQDDDYEGIRQLTQSRQQP